MHSVAAPWSNQTVEVAALEETTLELKKLLSVLIVAGAPGNGLSYEPVVSGPTKLLVLAKLTRAISY
jgi:hypothetical protein